MAAALKGAEEAEPQRLEQPQLHHVTQRRRCLGLRLLRRRVAVGHAFTQSTWARRPLSPSW
jgi:hypothetical protein